MKIALVMVVSFVLLLSGVYELAYNNNLTLENCFAVPTTQKPKLNTQENSEGNQERENWMGKIEN